MASTLAQGQVALAQLAKLINESSETSGAFRNEFAAVDQTSPTAIDQIKNINRRYRVFIEQTSTLLKENTKIVTDIIASLPSPEKEILAKETQPVTKSLLEYNAKQKAYITQSLDTINALEKAAEEKTKTAAQSPAPTEPTPAAGDDAEKSSAAAKEEADAKNSANAAAAKQSQPTESSPSPLGSASVSAEKQTTVIPNPLGNLSSYTYGLSLYMVNTRLMNQFILSGGSMANITGSNPGVVVVAQSGGLSATDQTLKSIDGTRIEYYIDDLNLSSILPGGPQKSTVGVAIKFKIMEPIGFAFLQDLTRAGFQLNKDSGIVAPDMLGIQQHFIIGIKFYGYDVDGNVIKQQPAGSKGNGSADTLPEKYFSIKISTLKFKLDGKMVTYQIDAVVLSDIVSNGQVNGLVPASTTLYGSTVGEVLANPANRRSLVSVLNNMKATAPAQFPTKYSIEFLDENDNPDFTIANQEIMNDATFENVLATTYPASTTEKSNIARQFTATSSDPNKSAIQLKFGTSILTVIDNVITKSQYLTQVLNEVTTAGPQPTIKENISNQVLKWYSVNPVVKIRDQFDQITNDWAYEVKFQIKQFKVPYVRLSTATRTSTYPGPSKRYGYWLTGENTEILSYEQSYDNLYYEQILTSQRTLTQPKGNSPRQAQSVSPADMTGSENRLSQFNAQAVAQLYSPGDMTQAKIKIMGDPGFIMSSTGVDGAGTLGNRNFQIDPLSGQVFIEIVFKMASDYDERGLVNISGRIQFYGDEILEKLNIQGVVYKVIKVESVFSKGTFTQTLELILADQNLLMLPKNTTKGQTGASAKVESSGNQRAEAPKVVAGVTLNSLGRTSGGPTAEELAAYQNRSPASVDLRTPQSSLSKGVQSLLNPAQTISKPTLTQLTNSRAYQDAGRSGIGGQAALNLAEKALAGNTANDDQNQSAQTQTPQAKQRNENYGNEGRR